MPSLSTTKTELLTKLVVFDHEILTGRVAARLFKCTVSEARSYLAQFIEQSEGRAHATYLVTGYIERNKEANGHAQDGVNGNGYLREEMELDGAPSSSRDTAAASQQDTKERLHCVMLVPQEELDERLALFSQILSNEVYSIEPSRLPDLALLSAANAPLLNDPTYRATSPTTVGRILHYRDEKDLRKSSNKSSGSSKGKASAETASTSKKATASTSSSSSSAAKPDLKRKASDIPVKNFGASSSKPAVSSKLANNSDTLPTPSPSKEKESGKAKSAPTTKSAADPAKETFSKGEEKAKEKARLTEEEEDEYADMYGDDDELMAELEGVDEAPKKPAEKKAKAPSGRPHVRKIRKTTKPVVSKNAKGYKVTTNVETDESYTGTESEGEDGEPAQASLASTAEVSSSRPSGGNAGASAVKKQAEKERERSTSVSGNNSSSSGAKKKAPTSSKPGEQASLKSFFGKPKAKPKQ